MRRVSLNARLAMEMGMTDEVYVALFYITHPDLDEPVRLSTDNTERLSDEPLMYGTRSTWMESTEPFYFVLASTILPSDLDDAPTSGNLVLENVDNDIAKVLRSFTTLATIHMAVVLASSPDYVEIEYRNMQIVSADLTAGEVTLSFSRQDIEEEKSPGGRMTRSQFPGLFS
ncbi:hypothetical protein GOZ83_05285 [Agrobacterium vitis]|uniref:hypothetical protein n=1 Tax=Rhizobium/Agrobacterium group TaxID=227290 RepID=UPI0012E7F662|nr:MULTISPECIES: hypothetical protein [Rhizobium/Agrobacterium group]MCF1492503.1 hypothetical protein [Allorhizobium ampelinum]MVA44495.1 hypothetical protein [Agrobacterium vitis]